MQKTLFLLFLVWVAPFAHADFKLSFGSRELIGAPVSINGDFVFMICEGWPLSIHDGAILEFHTDYVCEVLREPSSKTNDATQDSGDDKVDSSVRLELKNWTVPSAIPVDIGCGRGSGPNGSPHYAPMGDFDFDVATSLDSAHQNLMKTGLEQQQEILDSIQFGGSADTVVLELMHDPAKAAFLGAVEPTVITLQSTHEPISSHIDVIAGEVSTNYLGTLQAAVSATDDDCNEPSPRPPVGCPGCNDGIVGIWEFEENFDYNWWDQGTSGMEEVYTNFSGAAGVVNDGWSQSMVDQLLVERSVQNSIQLGLDALK